MTDSTDPAPGPHQDTRAKWLRWLAIGLGVSLMVNVFAAGHIAGREGWHDRRGGERASRFGASGRFDKAGRAARDMPKGDTRENSGRRAPPENVAFVPRAAIGAMPQDARAAFLKTVRGEMRIGRQARREIDAERTALAQTLQAGEDFDIEQVQAHFSRIRELTSSFEGGFERAFLAALEKMDTAERQAFASALTAARTKRREGRGGDQLGRDGGRDGKPRSGPGGPERRGRMGTGEWAPETSQGPAIVPAIEPNDRNLE